MLVRQNGANSGTGSGNKGRRKRKSKTKQAAASMKKAQTEISLAYIMSVLVFEVCLANACPLQIGKKGVMSSTFLVYGPKDHAQPIYIVDGCLKQVYALPHRSRLQTH